MLTVGILDNASSYKWSVQGFGMLRLYIRKVGRLHIWDNELRYPGVSVIHNHSWDLESTIIVGAIRNTRYTAGGFVLKDSTSGQDSANIYQHQRLVTL